MKPLWNLNWAVLPVKMAKSIDLDPFQSPWGPYLSFNHPHILFPLSKCGPTLKCPLVCLPMSRLKLPLYCWGRQVAGTTVTAGAPEGAPPYPPSRTHVGYSHLGRQQKMSDNWWALWGPRAADSLMEPSLSENYIYKADGARMKESRVPDRGASCTSGKFHLRKTTAELWCNTNAWDQNPARLSRFYCCLVSLIVFSSIRFQLRWDLMSALHFTVL